MRKGLKLASVVFLLPPLYLVFVLVTPWLAVQGIGIAAPWTTRLVFGQILAFPVLVGCAMGLLFLMWALLGWTSRFLSHDRRTVNVTPLLGILVSAVCVVLAANPVSESQTGPSEGETLSVVSWNVHDELNLNDLRDLVVDDPEVVVLPEASTGPLETHLAQLGKGGQYQIFATETKAGVSPTTVMISKNMGRYQVRDGAETTLGTLTVEPRDQNSRKPVILGVHTASPVPNWMDLWDSDVGNVLDAVCSPRHERERPVIAAGDYNANPWHGHMASIPSREGCSDALPSSGVSTGTWPSAAPAWARTQIDHIVVNGAVRVEDGKVMSLTGPSDHVPVTATLRY
ncbi:endonuclease/exonuclease/phosphatase family protein [Kocuria sp. TGY1127_2]|uniref:endonuclease/exonuclease/phosphatase family protein n=1 Tax=Kocuria sp. TGY1127_2 TaxID=2711328 RepID=UPI0015C0ACDB|nr:endonuclease/exonuclease/phosphatase family protein [Kocuria sp. TGY1127_2]